MVSRAGVAGTILQQRPDIGGETNPEAAVCCEEWLLGVELGGVGFEGEGAHLGADDAVGAVCADYDGSCVGAAVGAGDCCACGGGLDGGYVFGGMDAAFGGGGEG